METITITIEEYRSLLRDKHTLCALECGGVDDWSWYSESLSDYARGDSSDSKKVYFSKWVEEEIDKEISEKLLTL